MRGKARKYEPEQQDGRRKAYSHRALGAGAATVTLRVTAHEARTCVANNTQRLQQLERRAPAVILSSVLAWPRACLGPWVRKTRGKLSVRLFHTLDPGAGQCGSNNHSQVN